MPKAKKKKTAAKPAIKSAKKRGSKKPPAKKMPAPRKPSSRRRPSKAALSIGALLKKRYKGSAKESAQKPSRANISASSSAAKTTKKTRRAPSPKKGKGGAPNLGLGPRFSLALFENQHQALCKKTKALKKDRMEVLRDHLTRYPIR